jgi:three-Cys-motif partner protein
VTFYNADSNKVMLESVLPRFSYAKRTRALCVLDPYALTLDWEVVRTAGNSRAVEVFINFPVHHMNRNCKRENISSILPGERLAMDRFWGDSSWHTAMFRRSAQGDLFGNQDMDKTENMDLVSAYCRRRSCWFWFCCQSPRDEELTKRGRVLFDLCWAEQDRMEDRAGHLS